MLRYILYAYLVTLFSSVVLIAGQEEEERVVCHLHLNELYKTLEEGHSSECSSDELLEVDSILDSCFVDDPFRLLIQMKRIYDDFTERSCISSNMTGCSTDRLYQCMNLIFDDSWFNCSATTAALICLEGLKNDSCQTLQAIKMQYSILTARAIYCADVPIACVNKYGLWHAVQGTDCRKFTREVHGTGRTHNFDTWQGTKFDTRICGQQHEAQVFCAI